MSRNVKVITSDHFGAPQLLGDRWGYCVEMLRACLCEGFNERTDITELEMVENTKIKITYATPHNYVKNQTIKISGAQVPSYNDEFRVTEFSELVVFAESYGNINNYIGHIISSLTGAKSIVAPLGFIEKFKEGSKSAFTTDEEEAFFVIDDEKPAYWNGAATNTLCIAPLVYMTDKMTDINTDGKYIVPYLSSNPTWYKLKSYMDGANQKNGLWNFVSFGAQSTNGNTAAHRQIPAPYTIIGNGRMFYFLPELFSVSTVSVTNPIYGFGKINNDLSNDLNYMLIAKYRDVLSLTSTAGASIYVTQNRSHSLFRDFLPWSGANIDIGNTTKGILSIKNASRKAITDRQMFEYGTTNYELSGGITQTNYPDLSTYNYYIMPAQVMTEVGYAGKMAGMFFVANASSLIHTNKKILDYKYNGMRKKLYFMVGGYNQGNSSGATVSQTYNISLNNEDWYNYD